VALLARTDERLAQALNALREQQADAVQAMTLPPV